MKSCLENAKSIDSIEQNFRQYSHDLEQQLQTIHAELQYKNSQIHQLNDKISELSLESDQTQSLIDSVNSKEQEMITLRNRLQELENQLAHPTQVSPTSGDTIQKRLTKLEKVNNDLRSPGKITNGTRASGTE